MRTPLWLLRQWILRPLRNRHDAFPPDEGTPREDPRHQQITTQLLRRSRIDWPSPGLQVINPRQRFLVTEVQPVDGAREVPLVVERLLPPVAIELAALRNVIVVQKQLRVAEPNRERDLVPTATRRPVVLAFDAGLLELLAQRLLVGSARALQLEIAGLGPVVAQRPPRGGFVAFARRFFFGLLES